MNEKVVEINFPLRIIGDEKDPSHVVIEVSGSIYWNSSCGYIEGVTLRRPRISSSSHEVLDVLNVAENGQVTLNQCVIEANVGSKESLSNKTYLNRNGIVVNENGRLTMLEVGARY